MQRQEGRPTHSTSQHGQVHMSDQYSGMRLSPVVSLPMASLMQGSISRTSYVVSIGDDFRFPARLLVQTLQLKDELFRDRIDAFPFHSRYIGRSLARNPLHGLIAVAYRTQICHTLPGVHATKCPTP